MRPVHICRGVAGVLCAGALVLLPLFVSEAKVNLASEAIIYVLMAVVLLIRPRGLLGEEGMMT